MAGSTSPSQNVQSTPFPDQFWKLRCRKNAWREAHFQVKSVQNTPGSDHLWKLRNRKSARRRCAKHIWKSKTGGFEICLTVRCRKSAPLTNLTNLTYLTNFTNLANKTNLTNLPNKQTNKQTD